MEKTKMKGKKREETKQSCSSVQKLEKNKDTRFGERFQSRGTMSMRRYVTTGPSSLEGETLNRLTPPCFPRIAS